jgi:hypothetical protein
MPRSESKSSNRVAQWSAHEHVSPVIQSQAQELIDATGSPELAKQALEAAQSEAERSAGDRLISEQDSFAKRWGFQSYLDLFEASSLVRSAAGKNWRLNVVAGGWIVWNETDLAASKVFATKQDALAAVPSRSQT